MLFRAGEIPFTRTLRACTALIAVAGFTLRSTPVAADHPKPPLDLVYKQTFKTSGQSVWGPGPGVNEPDRAGIGRRRARRLGRSDGCGETDHGGRQPAGRAAARCAVQGGGFGEWAG